MTKVFGAQSQRFEGVVQACAAAQPACWKVINPDSDILRNIKQASPGTKTIVRIYTGAPTVDDAGQHPSPYDYGIEYANRVYQAVKDPANMDYLEMENEVNDHYENLTTFIQRLNAFMVGFSHRAKELRFKPLGPNFSTGYPEVYVPNTDYELWPNAWQGLVDGLRAIRDAGGALGLHEYDSPDLFRLWSDAKQRGYLVGRHKAIYSSLPADLQSLPLYITEFGIDWLTRGVEGGFWHNRDDQAYKFMIDQSREAWRRVYSTTPQLRGICFFLWGTTDSHFQEYDIIKSDESASAFTQLFGEDMPPPEKNMQAWYPKAERKPTLKYFPAALNLPLRAVVLHIAEGPYQAAVDWLAGGINPGSSAHFVIAKDGRVAQLVPIDRRAWANGTVAGSTWSGLIPGANPNLYTLSIEHEGFWNEPRTPAMEAAVAELLVWIRAQTGLVWQAHQTLIGHYELDRVTRLNCPGPHVDYETIAAAGNGEPPKPPENVMRTAQDIKRSSWKSIGVTFNDQEKTAFEKKAQALGLGYPLGNEYRDVDGGVVIAGQAFGPEGVALETVEGVWALDQIKPYSILTGEPWLRPAPSPAPVGIGKKLAYLFPRTLTEIGAEGVEGAPIDGKPFYRIAGGTVRRGVNTFCVVTVFTNAGTPAIGVVVANKFPDGNGEWQETDGSGVARFQFGASSAFSSPGRGPFEICLAESASKDEDVRPKVLTVNNRLSDTARSLGDWQAEHTEIYLQFIQQ